MANPSLAMIPSGYKDGTLYSPVPNTAIGDFDVSRGSLATRVNKNGLIETVGYTVGGDVVTNGDFATDTDWEKGTGWTIGSGVASCDGTQTATTVLNQIGTYTINKIYKITYTIVSITTGSIDARFQGGGATVAGANRTTSGTYTDYLTSTGNTGFRFRANTDFVGSIDNVSVIEFAGEDVPRLDYTDGGCPVLLTEPQSTNEIQSSEPTANEGGGSDGITYEPFNWSLGFSNCVRFGDNSELRFRYGGSVVSGNEYTISAFIIMDDLSEPNVGGDSVTGDFTFIIGGVYPTITSKQNMGNNIWRCEGYATATNTSQTGILKYTGQSNKGFRVVGWQLEELSYASSYIPTSGGTATRLGDVVTGAGSASTFNSTEGVLFAEISAEIITSFKNLSINDGTDANRINLYIYNSTLTVNFDVGGVNQSSSTYSMPDVTSLNKIAFSYKLNEFKLFVNGAQRGSTDTSGTVPSVGTFNQLSFNDGSLSKFYGKTSQVQVFNTALTDAELTILTT